MGFVEGVRGPDPIRWCECDQWTLQLVGQFYGEDENGKRTKEPIEYSHYPAKCPICLDEEKRRELLRDTA